MVGIAHREGREGWEGWEGSAAGGPHHRSAQGHQVAAIAPVDVADGGLVGLVGGGQGRVEGGDALLESLEPRLRARGSCGPRPGSPLRW